MRFVLPLFAVLIACGQGPADVADGGAGGGFTSAGGGSGGSGGAGGGSTSGAGGGSTGGGSTSGTGGGSTSGTGGGTTSGAGGGSTSGTGGGTSSGGDAGFPPLTMAEQMALMSRPYRLVVPASYNGSTAVPFVILLHGYTASGLGQDTYFRMSELAQARGFILATPDGLVDGFGQRYWNATNYCCGFNTTKQDDVLYLGAIMNEVRQNYRIDPKRVFFIGHSNGGFMSHRMACDRAPRIAGIVSLAGAQWKDESNCVPDGGVAVLQVHGTNDGTVSYNGGTLYPGAIETVTTWANLYGCGAALTSAGADIDIEAGLAGAETKREHFTGCAAGTASELWTIQNGGHVPNFNMTWAPVIYDWLLAHPKP